MNRIAILKNSVQEYAWGSKTFIPELIGEPSPAKAPQAELWMGSHPKAPSLAICNDDQTPLDKLINRDPEGTLGQSVAKKFNYKLPFLYKVLAASKPLSIQAHPNKEQAKEGFSRENLKKITLNDPDRNYRDENHKPELICALTPLWVLKGFREIRDIIGLMKKFRASAGKLGIDLLINQPNREGLKKFFSTMMTMEKKRQGSVINEILADPLYSEVPDSMVGWMKRLRQEYPGDIGVLSPLFLNLVQLQPSEAMYIPAGEPHAYLEGAGLELMANSDNVLRGGLTPKHIDLPELLEILTFISHGPDIIRIEGRAALESFYPVTAEEFMLSVISLHEEAAIYNSTTQRSAEIMICTKGNARIKDIGNGDVLELSKGIVVFVPASVKQYSIQGKATIHKASVPLQ